MIIKPRIHGRDIPEFLEYMDVVLGMKDVGLDLCHEGGVKGEKNGVIYHVRFTAYRGFPWVDDEHEFLESCRQHDCALWLEPIEHCSGKITIKCISPRGWLTKGSAVVLSDLKFMLQMHGLKANVIQDYITNNE